MRRRREDSIFNEGLDCGGKMKRLSDFMAGAKGFTLVGFIALTILAACDGSDNGMEAADSRKKSSNSKDNAKSFSSLCENCEDEAISSSSSAGGWVSSSNLESFNWSIPKENYLNPEITYGTMTDSRDGQTYKTVKIGEQVWMAENLNYADSTKTPSLLKRSWCYDDKAENCAVAGRLYTWAAAIDSAELYKDKSIDCGDGKTCTLPDTVYGVCPPGWHLPTNSEWNALFTAVGGQSMASKILKSQTGWLNHGNGTDAYGFSAFPAGSRDNYDAFDDEGDVAYFWSATEYYLHGAYSIYLYYSAEDAYLDGLYKTYAYSVRCLEN